MPLPFLCSAAGLAPGGVTDETTQKIINRFGGNPVGHFIGMSVKTIDHQRLLQIALVDRQQIKMWHTKFLPELIKLLVDCVKSRQRPNAEVETGHRSTTMSLLANISLATKLRLEWDADKEQITNSKEANTLLHYEYRSPWKLG